MSAELIGIGPFREKLLEYYEYPSTSYEGTREGAIITVLLFGVEEGSAASRELALSVGVRDAWDFNQHKISPAKVNKERVIEYGNQYPDYKKDCISFLKLMENGYEFHFLPNG